MNEDIKDTEIEQIADDYVTTNDIAAYMKDIEKYPFLKNKEEIDLKKTTEAGSVAKILLKTQSAADIITDDNIHNAINSTKDYHIELWESHFDDLEEALKGKTVDQLPQIVKDGNKAREKLITGSLRFVIKMSKGYSNSISNMAQADLVQEGNIGLMTGIEHYDYKTGYSLLTYCSYWIRQRIERSISEQDRAIRLPVHFDSIIRRVAVYRKNYYSRNGEYPDEKTIRKEFKLSHDSYISAMDHLSGVVSLDTYINPDGDETSTLSDFIVSPEKTPESQYVDQSFSEEIFGFLNNDEKYSQREREIFLCRMGFLDGGSMTLESIGQRYGITRERVRQIENGVRRKLRKDLVKKYGIKGFNEMQRAAVCG